MCRFDHNLSLTRSLTIVLVCGVVCFAQEEHSKKKEKAESTANRKLPALSASEIASTLYRDPSCRHIAFTCGNHNTLSPFKDLDSFLKTTASKDTNFRYVLIELPADLKPRLISVSKGEVTYDEFLKKLEEPWRRMMTSRPQLAFYSTLLKTIQKINAARPKHPILLVPVDGFTTKRVMYEVNRARDAQKKSQQVRSYIDSTNRERDTAANVLEVVKEFPKARGAILYHQGHLLRGLRRELPELDDESHRLVKLEVTHSTWVGFAQEANPEFGKGLRIVLYDEIDKTFNPNGVLLSKELGGQEYDNLSGSILRNTAASQLEPVKYFQPDSRVRRVHLANQHFPKSIGQIFDAFVVIRD